MRRRKQTKKTKIGGFLLTRRITERSMNIVFIDVSS